MRHGKLLALRWADVDLDGATAQVRASLRRTRAGGLALGPTKTRSSARLVTLSPACVEALRQHRERQDHERARAGRAELGLVFPNRVGRPIEAQNLLYREFYPLLEVAGLPRVRFHALRHTCATLLLAAGGHPKVVQELLGHSLVSVTMDLYSHMIPSLMRGPAATMDRVLG